jgi:hypothetical protein
MPAISVKRGQSLWSIATSVAKQTSAAPSNATVKELSNAIAAANGLAPEAKLRAGQQLQLPDALAGASAAATARLSSSTSPAAGAVGTRLKATAKPMLDLKAVFVDTPTKRVGQAQLPAVAGVPLDGVVQEFQGVKSYIGAAAIRTTEAVFGALTQRQFDDVHAALGGRSTVRFDPARSYRLQDFLPPALQALVGKDLEIPAAVALKGTKKIAAEDYYFPRDDDHRVGLTLNCHAAAWEAMRAYQGPVDSVAVCYGEMVVMDGAVQDAAAFELRHEVPAAEIDGLLALDLRPGDLVQLHGTPDMASASTNLMHSAVYVGGGLFFEKPNTEGPELADPANYVDQDETPLRLATLADMVQPVREAMDGKIRVEVRRPVAALPDAAAVFGSTYQQDFDAWAAKKGRALGVELVREYEQGMAGNIRAESVSALVRVGLRTNDDGTASLAG